MLLSVSNIFLSFYALGNKTFDNMVGKNAGDQHLLCFQLHFELTSMDSVVVKSPYCVVKG